MSDTPQLPSWGAGLPVALPAQRRRARRWVLLGGVLVAVIAAAVVVFLTLLWRGDGDSNAFLSQLERGDTVSAYARLSPEMQRQQDEQTFSAGVRAFGLSDDCTIRWNRYTLNGDSKQVQGWMSCPRAPLRSYNVELTWVKQQGVYKVAEYRFTAR